MQAGATYCLDERIAHAIERTCVPPWRDDLLRCVPIFAELMAYTRDLPRERLARAVRAVIAEHCLVIDGGDWPEDEFDGIEQATRIIVRCLHSIREVNEETDAAEPAPQLFG